MTHCLVGVLRKSRTTSLMLVLVALGMLPSLAVTGPMRCMWSASGSPCRRPWPPRCGRPDRAGAAAALLGLRRTTFTALLGMGWGSPGPSRPPAAGRDCWGGSCRLRALPGDGTAPGRGALTGSSRRVIGAEDMASRSSLFVLSTTSGQGPNTCSHARRLPCAARPRPASKGTGQGCPQAHPAYGSGA